MSNKNSEKKFKWWNSEQRDKKSKTILKINVKSNF